jgi:hypothetical protein
MTSEKGGAPPKFKTAKELQAKIDKYFKNCPDKKKIVTKAGKVIEVPIPTICGLCLYCGFESRQSFYDYEKRPAFSYTIKRARLFIEKEYEQMLQGQNCTGAIFALKNLGWIDKTSQEITGKDGEPLTTVKKVYVTKEDIKAVDDEIDRVINE